MAYRVTAFTKEGSVILLTVEDKPNPIKIDCRTMEITSYTGRKVKYFPSTVCNGLSTETERWAFTVIKERTKGYETHNFRVLEMFFTHLDRVPNPYNMPCECPEGYIKWVMDNDEEISTNSLRRFEEEKALQNMSTVRRSVYNKLRERWNATDRICRVWIDTDYVPEECAVKISQIFKVSAKGFNWSLCDSLYTFFRHFFFDGGRNDIDNEKWWETLDGNRDFDYNVKMAIENRDRERNNKILANENKIRAIEELSTEHLIVIVPSTMDDFTNEGKMQNNCVGYYYHDSIARGTNLVYFIRKRVNANRSYITNRYNVPDEQTVETRKVNNDWNNDSEAIALIKEIDKKIKELLSEE